MSQDADEVAICYRCQMRLPLRLVQFVVGPRGGTDAICAACRPDLGDEKRAEAIAMRKSRYQR